MGAVADAVSDVVGGAVEAVGDVTQAVVDTAGSVVEQVGTVVENTVQSALENPEATILKVAAVATQQYYLLPYISAAETLDNGGSIEQAFISGAKVAALQGVGSEISESLQGTSFNEALKEIGTETGIQSLPSAVARGIGTAGVTAGADLLQGKSLEEALARGATAGIGSTVGSAVTAEADTGGAGTNTLDRLLGSAAGATTTAGLRGQDVNTAIANSIVGTGINAAGSGIASLNADEKPIKTAEAEDVKTPTDVQLASTDGSSITDTGLTPTEEAIKNMKAEVKEQTPEEKAAVDQLVKALYPEEAKKEEEDRIFKKIVEETERKRREEEEFNNLRDMLWEEELEGQKKPGVQSLHWEALLNPTEKE
jgi:hypothetical protein